MHVSKSLNPSNYNFLTPKLQTKMSQTTRRRSTPEAEARFQAAVEDYESQSSGIASSIVSDESIRAPVAPRMKAGKKLKMKKKSKAEKNSGWQLVPYYFLGLFTILFHLNGAPVFPLFLFVMVSAATVQLALCLAVSEFKLFMMKVRHCCLCCMFLSCIIVLLVIWISLLVAYGHWKSSRQRPGDWILKRIALIWTALFVQVSYHLYSFWLHWLVPDLEFIVHTERTQSVVRPETLIITGFAMWYLVLHPSHEWHLHAAADLEWRVLLHSK